MLLDVRHDLFTGHILIVGLGGVFSFIAVSPLLVVVFIEDIELTDQLVGADLDRRVTLLFLVAFLALLFGLLLIFFLLLIGGGFVGSCGTGSLFFRSQCGFFIETRVEFLQVIGDFAEESFLFLDPLASFVSHLVLDVVAFDSQNLLLKLHAFLIELLLVLNLSLLGVKHSGLLGFERIGGHFFLSLRSTDHA